MVSAIITILYSVALVVASFFYLKVRYKLLENNTLKGVAKKNIKYLILTAVVFVVLSVVETIYALKHDIYSLPVLMKWSTLFWGIYLLAKVDFHEKKIPNKIVLALIILRIGFLTYEVLANDIEYIKTVLGYPLLGAVIGGTIMIVAMLLSRKGVGMGDVKMFIVIGAFVGSTEILATMFYTFLISAIGGILLMVTKKAGVKDFIPMAPFACAGVAVEYLFLMIGG